MTECDAKPFGPISFYPKRPCRGTTRPNQGRVRADEGAPADRGAVLREPVVVAGDGAGADIRVGADGRVADVGEVVHLRAGAELGVLDLDEVADAHLLAERGA